MDEGSAESKSQHALMASCGRGTRRQTPDVPVLRDGECGSTQGPPVWGEKQYECQTSRLCKGLPMQLGCAHESRLLSLQVRGTVTWGGPEFLPCSEGLLQACPWHASVARDREWEKQEPCPSPPPVTPRGTPVPPLRLRDVCQAVFIPRVDGSHSTQIAG